MIDCINWCFEDIGIGIVMMTYLFMKAVEVLEVGSVLRVDLGERRRWREQ